MSVLDRIVEHKRGEVARRKRGPAVAEAGGELNQPALDFRGAVRRPGLSLIAEIKRRSPSRGWIGPDVDVETQAARYRQGGAAALSVLTDEAFFGARPDDLARAKAASGLPTLRKDFIVDPWQVCESKGMGADAVLLIVAALPDAAMRECLHVASALGLVVLVEVHNDSELDRAVDAGAELVGVNNRDLRTFAVDLERGLRMRERIPAHCLAVAESGIRTPADVQAVRRAGFDAVLIGEALMESPDPARLIRELLTDDSASSKRAARAYGHSP